MSGEIGIGADQVALVDKTLTLSVCADLSVRVRIRGADGQLLADIATTPKRALLIAGLFRRAAESADPSLCVVHQLEVTK